MSTLKRMTAVSEAASKLYGKYIWQISALISLSFLNGLLGGIGITALVPLFSFVVKENEALNEPISKVVIQSFAYLGVDFRLRNLLIVICSLFVLKAVVLAVFGYVQVRIIASYEVNTRYNLYSRILSSNWSYLLKQKIGHVENALVADVGQTSGMLTRISGFILHSISFIIYAIAAFSISLPVAIITIASGGIILLLSQPLIARSKIYAKETHSLKKDIAHQVNENMIGLKTIKIMEVEKKIAAMVNNLFEKLKMLATKMYLARSITSEPLEPLSLIFGSIVFAIVYKRPSFNLASFLVVLYLIQKIFIYTEKFQSLLNGMIEALPSAQRLLSLEKELDESVEETVESRGALPFHFDREIEFRGVNFSYVPEKQILENVNFKIKKGEMIGIVGPSGCGKTTISDLLMRLFLPQQGEILIDGKKINDVEMGTWRRNIGYVSQDIFLKNDTIENNIKFYDEKISDESMTNAAKMANAYDFISELPGEFEAVVGERGVMLSGGQRQRIALARVLARSPQILILDEATSSIDNQSEALIKKAIDGLKGRVTIISIAHRFSTIMDADRVLVMDDGKLIEEGAPSQLIQNKDSYFYKSHHAIS